MLVQYGAVLRREDSILIPWTIPAMQSLQPSIQPRRICGNMHAASPRMSTERAFDLEAPAKSDQMRTRSIGIRSRRSYRRRDRACDGMLTHADQPRT